MIISKIEYIKKIETLRKWAYAYYVNDNPIATDEEYDMLSRDLLKYEDNNPIHIIKNTPLDSVGWGSNISKEEIDKYK